MMVVRDMVHINEDLCDGCGECVPSCAEGAIQIVDGKARLVGDALCDGLGACLGHCPQGAITVIRRSAAAYDEAAVARHLASLGRDPQANHPTGSPLPLISGQGQPPSCPGSRVTAWEPDSPGIAAAPEGVGSKLRQWPIQLHLLPPTAGFLEQADVLLAADCVAFSVAGFHSRFLDGRALAIACPKLDSHQEIYVEKLAAMIDLAGIRELTVMVMEVPCCGGLVSLAQQAMARARRSVPAKALMVGVRGDILGTRRLGPSGSS